MGALVRPGERPVPVDDLGAGGRPHPLPAHDAAQRGVQAPDAERLPDQPRVQVQPSSRPVVKPSR